MTQETVAVSAVDGSKKAFGAPSHRFVHSKDAKLKNTSASPIQIRLRAERANANIGKGLKKAEKLTKVAPTTAGPNGVPQWAVVLLLVLLVGGAIVAVVSKVADDEKLRSLGKQ